MDNPAKRRKTDHTHDSVHSTNGTNAADPYSLVKFHGQGIQNTESGHISVGRDINIGSRSNDIETLRKVRLTDPRDDKTRIEQQKGGLLHDSYAWILDHKDFQRWRDDEGSRLLWIRGDPGKGKTMLLCGIIDELDDTGTGDRNVVYYFCQATSNQLNQATSVLRGLIFSLLSQRRELLESVRKDIDEAGEQRFQDMNGWAALCRIFNRLIEETEARQQTTYLIVDALDECLQGQSGLLEWIAALSSSRLRVLVSSRNWPSIESGLSSATRKIMLQLELNAGSISAAVDRYIDFKTIDLARSKGLDTETREAARQYLKSNSGNTFLWVALVCKKLGREDTHPWAVLDTLYKFPPGLDELYKRMATQFIDSENAEICRQVLAAQVLAYRPLSLTELLSLVESPEMFLQLTRWLPTVVKLCGSFLTVKDDTIYFVHQSAKDYLIEHESAFIFRQGLHVGHHTVFRQLIQALSRTLRENIYQLPSLGSRVDSIKVPNPDPLSGMRYGCVYWADHLGNADLVVKQDLDDRGLVHMFLEEHLLHWLEALSLLKSLGSGIEALTKVSSLLRASKKKEQDLSKLLYDAGKFVRLHKIGIETAPLQAYSSALIFSPTRSIVRKLFLKNPDWLLMSPTRDRDWSPCLQELEGHTENISAVAFSPNGRHVASGSVSSTIRIWDMATGGCVNILKGHVGIIDSIVFSPNSEHVASSATDSTIRIWHAASGICLQTLKGGFANFKKNLGRSMAFLNNESVISVNHDRWCYKWNIKTGDRLGGFRIVHRDDLQNSDDLLEKLCLSRSGRRAAWVSRCRTGIEVIDTVAGCYHEAPWYQEVEFSCLWPSQAVTLSPDGEYMATTTNSPEKKRDAEIQIWNVTKNLCIKTLRHPPYGPPESLALSPDNKYLAAQWSFIILEWEIATGRCVKLNQVGRYTLPNTLEFSYDSTLLVSSGPRQVRVWEMATTRLRRRISANLGLIDDAIVQPRHITLSLSGGLLGLLDHDEMFQVWDTRENKLLSEIALRCDASMLVFSPNSMHLACTWEQERKIRVFNAMSGRCLWEARTGYESARVIAFSPDGRQLASLHESSSMILIWDAATGTRLNTVPISIDKGIRPHLCSPALSPDGTKMAIAFGRLIYIVPVTSPSSGLGAYDAEDEVQTRDAITSSRTFPLDSASSTFKITFSPDSRYIACIGLRNVDIIDTATGALLKTLLDFYTMQVEAQFDSAGWVPAGIQTRRGIYNTRLLLEDARDSIEYGHGNIPSGALSGVGISETGDWILRNGEAYLWVPPEHRPELVYDFQGNTIAFGRAIDEMYCIRVP
ncbi:hypothetical protein ANO14919_100670 [Xylariales sp. No.14919]|nr:hypothetical protein ANO14919_100670 [Xylariales sp. No.14919]